MDKALNMEAERVAFEAWAKPQPYWWNGKIYSDLHTQIAWDTWLAARRATSTSAPGNTAQFDAVMRNARAVVKRWDAPLWRQEVATADFINQLRRSLDAAEQARLPAIFAAPGELLPLPEPDHSLDCGMQPFYRPDQMQRYAHAAVAADRAQRVLAPMCERKTNDIIERERYEKTGYVLKRAGRDICVVDAGAVAWFTAEQWSWLMFNRDKVEFDWPKPIGADRAQRAAVEPAPGAGIDGPTEGE